MTKTELNALIREAREAGRAAIEAATPTPMVVGSPVDLMGSLTGGDSGGLRKDRPIYHVSEGVCGIGAIRVTPGNSKLANHLRRKGLGRTDSYAGGLRCSIMALTGYNGQSYERLSAAANAIAKIFSDAGYTTYADVRLD